MVRSDAHRHLELLQRRDQWARRPPGAAVLMALLFVAGVMNLLWMAIITAFVLFEKILPNGKTFGRFGGVAMIVWAWR